MDCIESAAAGEPIELLTQADKLAYLEKLFSPKRPKADVFLPDETFYSEIRGPEDAERIADTLFKWLGIKHRSISFHIDPNQDKLISYEKHGATSTVSLGWRVQADQFLCAAAVAHAVVHHVLLARSKITLSNTHETEELTDLGTIHAGFGIIIMNSLNSAVPALGSLAAPNYIAECQDYFSEQRIVSSVWSPFVLTEVLNVYAQDINQQRSAGFVSRRLKRGLKRKHKLHVAAALFASAALGAGFLFIQRPKHMTPELQAQADTIKILKSQFEQCEDTVKRKQQTWNTDDIFIQRQIEADMSRCSSLRSRYNHEVSRYNSQL